MSTKWFYICGMEKTLTIREAWADFYEWAKTNKILTGLPKAERRRVYDAQADYLGSRGQKLGNERIKDIIEKYAPERYRFEQRVILIEP